MKFLATIFLLVALAMSAAPQPQFALAWDASPSPEVTSYTLHGQNVVAGVTNTVSVASITNLTVGVYDISSGNWTFWVTARAGLIESIPSNLLPVLVPNSPSGLKTVVLQYSATISGPWSSNIFLKLMPLP